VEVQAACVIYKLSRGSKLLTCSKLFALNKSIIGLVIRKVVITINNVFTNLISWTMGGNMEVAKVQGFTKCASWCHKWYAHFHFKT
jgi:hypothetical protein